MLVLGLTGSIGMGKSTTSQFFREAGIPVHDADAVVHRLYSGAAAPLIEAAFPGVATAGTVDRTRLGAAVLGKPEALKKLEAIVHPLVQAEKTDFLARCRAAGHQLAVLDIPLLFETGGDVAVDAVIVVSAPADIQRARVLARPGMTAEKLDAILARQMPDSDKRRRAHMVVDTSHSFEAARRQVQSIVRAFAGSRGSH